ncbi:type IV pilus modification protein PilV [Aquabacterium sp.]|uniref:type IV pilus modification protein PilV n=1 Tax=Aquabacterium sp. TaxID=1872578 RepID=UPI003D6CB9C9
MNSPRRPHGRQGGATLIEILVSILIISFGILAMVVMQLNTTKFAKANEYQAMGALLAADLADRIRANRPQANEVAPSYSYQVPYSTSTAAPTAGSGCNTTTDQCTPQQMAAKDLADWRTSVRNSLPQGDAFVTADASGIDLWLIWLEPNSTGENNTNLSPNGNNVCPAAVLNTSLRQVPTCMHFRTDL